MKDWEKAYQEGITPWDKGDASPPIAHWLQEHSLKGKGLVLGCGLGHDVRLLAGYSGQVTGMDISQTAISKARKMDAVNNESYIVADFFNLDEAYTQSFDWVVEHTFFCAIIPDLRHSYVRNLVKVLRPKGYFLAVFFLQDPLDPNTDGPPYKIERASIEEYFAKDFDIMESFIPETHYECRPTGSEYLCWMRLK
ncbi:MAG: methyltransferase domain-containing protein [Verrucomicrobia bacterium]|nr:methyltransferase domain-containing protein [Verrucomicrobiota bacterium]